MSIRIRNSIPYSGSRVVYLPNTNRTPHMDTTTARAALWQRVQSLMEAKWGAPNLNRLARSAGVGVATIARMKSAGTSVGLDALEKVSAALDVQAWRLICPQSVLDEKAQEPSPLALDQAAASSQEAASARA